MRRKQAEKLVRRLGSGGGLRALMRTGRREKGWVVMGRGMIQIIRDNDEYDICLINTVWDENLRKHVFQSEAVSFTENEVGAVDNLVLYADGRSVEFF